MFYKYTFLVTAAVIACLAPATAQKQKEKKKKKPKKINCLLYTSDAADE